MDFRIVAVTVLFSFLFSRTDSLPQRSLNAVNQSSKDPSRGKVGDGKPELTEDPKQAKIMKQINKVNEDGSYTFGYESSDGSFRVETRFKDGVVKGKYGYVDANGQLKVMEYTAGEKTGDEEEEEQRESNEENENGPFPPQPQQPQPVKRQQQQQLRRIALSPSSPQPQQIRYAVRQADPQPPVLRVVSRPLPPSPYRDQTFAAQTQSRKVAQAEESGEDDKTSQEDEEEDGGSQQDVNNGQYFRAVGPQGPTPSPTPPGVRYATSRQFQGGQDGQPQQQQFNSYPQGFSTLPREYSLGPIPQYAQQGSPFQGQQGPSPYSGGQFDPNAFQGQQQQQLEYNPQLGRLSPDNVGIQFRGEPRPRDEGSLRQLPQLSDQELYLNIAQPGQGPQGFQGQGFERIDPTRQFQQSSPQSLGGLGRSQSPQPSSGQYVPNVDLDGFSEDADQDGFVDAPPSNSLKEAAQERQAGIAVKAVGPGRIQSQPGEAYRPQVLGPQGVPQGGQISLGNGPSQFSPNSLGPQSGPSSGQFLGEGFPRLTDEQIQQLFAQQQPQFLGNPGQGQGQISGIPQREFAPQGFPQGGGGQPQFLGGSGGPSSPNGPYSNPFLQGPYIPSSQGQGGPQGLGGGSQLSPENLGQYSPQFQGQGQFLGGQGQGGPSPFLQQGPIQSSRPQLSSEGSQGQGGGPIQSAGFPFDFSPFGTQGGFQSFPPPQFQGFAPEPAPSQGAQGQPQQPSFSPAGTQALNLGPQQLSQGGGGGSGFQLQPNGPQIQGFLPGRFPPPGPQQGQQFFSIPIQSGGGNLQGQGSSSSPSSSPVSVQLGGGSPRPVQHASNQRQLSSSPSGSSDRSSSGPKSN